MKKVTFFKVSALTFILSFSIFQSYAQSGNTTQQSGDAYAYAYTASEEELASIAADRLFERGYAAKKTSQTVDVNKKGCAIILQTSYTNQSGEKVTVHGTATGCKDMEEAKEVALQNLQRNNPSLKPNESYKVVAKFVNK